MTVTTTQIDLRTPVGKFAADLPASTRIFERWKIDYCCGGGVALQDACIRAGAPVDMVVAEISRLAESPRAEDWASRKLSDLADYIVRTHHVYTREECQALVALSSKVEGVHGENHAELREIAAIVKQLHAELFNHMMKEEQILFPYVTSLEAETEGGVPAPQPFFGTVENPIRMMMFEHDQAAEMLRALRRLTGDYELPADACNSFRALYHRLQDLEADLHQHIHLENNIYFPRALDLEKKAIS